MLMVGEAIDGIVFANFQHPPISQLLSIKYSNKQYNVCEVIVPLFYY